mmetsp:Transcript_35466/g.111615  ORF Transcript_35466/g.111615 Transcript_35466/m.111615 type:complete len:384 (-) Transcript_35466:450-1601(-)
MNAGEGVRLVVLLPVDPLPHLVAPGRGVAPVVEALREDHAPRIRDGVLLRLDAEAPVLAPAEREDHVHVGLEVPPGERAVGVGQAHGVVHAARHGHHLEGLQVPADALRRVLVAEMPLPQLAGAVRAEGVERAALGAPQILLLLLHLILRVRRRDVLHMSPRRRVGAVHAEALRRLEARPVHRLVLAEDHDGVALPARDADAAPDLLRLCYEARPRLIRLCAVPELARLTVPPGEQAAARVHRGAVVGAARQITDGAEPGEARRREDGLRAVLAEAAAGAEVPGAPRVDPTRGRRAEAHVAPSEHAHVEVALIHRALRHELGLPDRVHDGPRLRLPRVRQAELPGQPETPAEDARFPVVRKPQRLGPAAGARSARGLLGRPIW